MDLTLPTIPKVAVRHPDGTVLFEEEVSAINEAVRYAQQGIDVKDAANTDTWTGRLAAYLNQQYNVPLEKSLTPGQAFLLSSHVCKMWDQTTKSFFQGLQ